MTGELHSSLGVSTRTITPTEMPELRHKTKELLREECLSSDGKAGEINKHGKTGQFSLHIWCRGAWELGGRIGDAWIKIMSTIRIKKSQLSSDGEME